VLVYTSRKDLKDNNHREKLALFAHQASLLQVQASPYISSSTNSSTLLQ
jgi:hypothetical protein